ADANGWVENANALLNHSARRTVQIAHEAGALVSFNHAWGTSNELLPIPDPEAQRDLLVQTRAFGADILEVGYRQRGLDLDAFLWLWDELLASGTAILGNGVSDTHGGNADNWRNTPNNFVTWILAASTAHGDLLDGLRRGRVFFGDLTLFDGHADHGTADGWRMGSIVVTDRASAEISTVFDGLASGDTVRIIATGVPVSSEVVTGSSFATVTELVIDPGAPSAYLRAEVYGADGTAKVFTNPVVFLPVLPSAGLAHHRGGFDLRGYRSLVLDHLRLIDLCIFDQGPDARLDLVLETTAPAGQGATVVIDASAHGRLPEMVTLNGLAAVITTDAEALTITLTDLVGSGTLTLSDGLPRCPLDANCDNLVNFFDLELILTQWGQPTPNGYAGDLSGDGFVNFADLNEVLEAWGEGCGGTATGSRQ
ncbi:MAG: hypothetical protein KDA21_04055, partial [Phycisphaerales bacterium]|nr:hypothetical protein [Phycisphaerales bacterium]